MKIIKPRLLEQGSHHHGYMESSVIHIGGVLMIVVLQDPPSANVSTQNAEAFDLSNFAVNVPANLSDKQVRRSKRCCCWNNKGIRSKDPVPIKAIIFQNNATQWRAHLLMPQPRP